MISRTDGVRPRLPAALLFLQLVLVAVAGTPGRAVAPAGWSPAVQKSAAPSAPTGYVVTPLTGLLPLSTLNNYGQLVGSEVVGGTTHTSLWTPAEPNSPNGQLTRISIQDSPLALNDYGQVLTVRREPGTDETVYQLWTPGSAHGTAGSFTTLNLPGGPAAMAADGAICGLVDRGQPNGDQVFAWLPSSPNGTAGSVRIVTNWEPGTAANSVYGVNAGHTAIGQQYYMGDDGFAHLQGIALNLDSGGLSVLPEPIVGQGVVAPSDINDVGEIIGFRQDLLGTSNWYVETVLWKPAYTKTVLPFEAGYYTRLNNHGDVLIPFGSDKGIYTRTPAGGYQRIAAVDQALAGAGLSNVQFTDLNDARQVLVYSGGEPYLLSPGNGRELKVFDANIEFSNGQELPAAAAQSLEPLTTPTWQEGAKERAKVAADGVTLLLLRLKLAPGTTGTGRFRIEEDPVRNADLGSLWPVTSTSLKDATAVGGTRDTAPDGPTQIDVPLVTIDGNPWAFALYRSPRNFDPDNTTWSLPERTLRIRAGIAGEPLEDTIATPMDVVRPLVILQHGTFSDIHTWDESNLPPDATREDGFTLWLDGAQDDRIFQYDPNSTNHQPFYVARTSFKQVTGFAAGPLRANARYVLPQVIGKLRAYRNILNVAATQADVITHSYGGPTMRQVAQLEQVIGPTGGVDPLTRSTASFRRLQNWGHGYFHKLITIAATHRGSAVANHSANLNRNGLIPGFYANVASWIGKPNHTGAMRDQFVMSPALKALRESFFPSHSFVGSGVVERGYSRYENAPFTAAYMLDKLGGPYKKLGKPWIGNLVAVHIGNMRKQTNYQFNMNATVQSGPEGEPNYDLTVGSRSASAGLSRPFISDVRDLFGTNLAGGVSHLLQTNSKLVSQRMIFLLRQKTTSEFFTHFPPGSGRGSKPLSPTETKLSNTAKFNPDWLGYGISGDTAAPSRAPVSAPTLTANVPGPDVCPGDRITLTVAWPGKTIDAAMVWRSGVGEGSPGDLVGADNPSLEIVVPNRAPGAFGIVAIVTATDGASGEAHLQFEICDPTIYTEIAVEPNPIVIQDTTPTPIQVMGKLPDETWRSLGTSRYTTLTIANPQIARVSTWRSVVPINFGQTTLHVEHRGATVDVPVTVDGVPVPVMAIVTGRPPTVNRTSTRAVEFAFLSATGFDARTIDPESVRIGGLAPVSAAGVVTVSTRDVNRDGKQDLVVKQVPANLNLAAGPAQIRMLAATRTGSLVGGDAAVTVR